MYGKTQFAVRKLLKNVGSSMEKFVKPEHFDTNNFLHKSLSEQTIFDENHISFKLLKSAELQPHEHLFHLVS